MKILVRVLLILLPLLGGCAPGYYVTEQAPEYEYPAGPGTIPPSWYDYDPAMRHWFDPWYENPYIQN